MMVIDHRLTAPEGNAYFAELCCILGIVKDLKVRVTNYYC